MNQYVKMLGGIKIYVNNMKSISAIQFTFPVETSRSKRSSLLKDLYQLYISQPDVQKKENLIRYRNYLRVHHPTVLRKSTFNRFDFEAFKEEFKKAKLPKDQKCITYVKESRFWYFFSHIPTDDLPYIISVARDKIHRGECVSKYLLGSVKSI